MNEQEQIDILNRALAEADTTLPPATNIAELARRNLGTIWRTEPVRTALRYLDAEEADYYEVEPLMLTEGEQQNEGE